MAFVSRSQTPRKPPLYTSKLFSSSSVLGKLFTEEVNIIYDSKCNVCKLEIDFLAARDRKRSASTAGSTVGPSSPRLKFTDLEDEKQPYDPSDPANGGVTYEEGMAAIHAVTSDGKVLKGVPVFRVAYENVGLGWLFAITTWPVIKQVVNFAYTIFARYRTNVTRGASLDELVRLYRKKNELKEQQVREALDCDSCKTKGVMS